MENLQVEIVENLEGLTRYADDWNALAFQSPQRLPTLSYAWVSAYFENMLEPGETWRCLFALHDNRLIGLLPIVISQGSFLGFRQFRAKTPSNKHCFAVDFLSLPEYQAEMIHILLSYLLRQEPNLYDFSLSRLPETSPTLGILSDNQTRGLICVKDYDGNGSYLPITGGFESFTKNLSPNFSRNVAKSRKKLSKLPDNRVTFLTGSDANQESFRQFLKVEASGWKGKAGTAILMSPQLVNFYDNLVRKLSSMGNLELHFLEAENKYIAAQMAVKMGRTLALLKIGYDESYSFCSPGNILFEKTVERAYASNDTDEINCITDMPWHDNWKMLKRPYYNLWIYPRRPFPYMVGVLGRRAKNELRQLPVIPDFYRRFRDMIKKEST